MANISLGLKIKAKNLSELVNSQYKLLANNNAPFCWLKIMIKK